MKAMTPILAALVLGIGTGVLIAFLRDSDAGPQYEELLKVSSRPSFSQPLATVDRTVGGAVVVKEGEVFDFGVMDRGETKSHSFEFLNDTSQPLKLKVGATTCKCTVGELENEVVPPGEVGNVTLEWIAKSYDPSFSQMATIETSDASRSMITLTVKGQVLQLVQPVPQGLFLNDLPFGSEREHQVVIYSFQEGSELTVLDHEFDDASTSEFFKFSWEPVSLEQLENPPPGVQSAVACSVKVLSGLPYGKVAQSLRITTDAERSSVVELAIGGRVVSDLMISGPGYDDESGILILGMVPATGKQVGLRLVARRADVHPVEFTSIETHPSELLQAEVGEPMSLKNGSVLIFPLKIDVVPSSRGASYMGKRNRPKAKILLNTTHPVAKQLEIEVRFMHPGGA